MLDAHAPRKTKVLRGNHKPHVYKNLCKAIMKRSALKRETSRTKQQKDNTTYKKQRNLVVKLQYFNNLEVSKNWCNSRNYFSNKYAHCDAKIILFKKEEITTNTNEIVEKETLLVNNDQIVKTFNKHFAETVEKLNTFE